MPLAPGIVMTRVELDAPIVMLALLRDSDSEEASWTEITPGQ
jgi:hypothetical protein